VARGQAHRQHGEAEQLEVLRTVRGGGDAPVLVVAEQADEHTAVRWLDDGADDFMAKPASAAELVVRIEVLGRRSPGGRERRRQCSRRWPVEPGRR
jgi:DNA-binding response OmpR family regulator